MGDGIKGASTVGQIQVFAVKAGAAHELVAGLTEAKYMPNSPEVRAGEARATQYKNPIQAKHISVDCNPVLHTVRFSCDPQAKRPLSEQKREMTVGRDICHTVAHVQSEADRKMGVYRAASERVANRGRFVAQAVKDGPAFYMGVRYDGRSGQMGMYAVYAGANDAEVQRDLDHTEVTVQQTLPAASMSYELKLRQNTVMCDGTLGGRGDKAYVADEQRDGIRFTTQHMDVRGEEKTEQHVYPVVVDVGELGSRKKMNFVRSPKNLYITDLNGDSCPDVVVPFYGHDLQGFSESALVMMNIGGEGCRKMEKRSNGSWRNASQIEPRVRDYPSSWVELTPDDAAITYE